MVFGAQQVAGYYAVSAVVLLSSILIFPSSINIFVPCKIKLFESFIFRSMKMGLEW